MTGLPIVVILRIVTTLFLSLSSFPAFTTFHDTTASVLAGYILLYCCHAHSVSHGPYCSLYPAMSSSLEAKIVVLGSQGMLTTP